MKALKNLVLLLTLALVVALPNIVHATSFTFNTPSGSTAGGQPVSATVTFNTDPIAGTLSISLTNLQANPTSVVQNISDLFFTLSNATLAGMITTDGTDNLINVDGSGNKMSAGTGAAGWQFSVTGGLYHLDGLQGTSTPAHTIIGPPGAMGTYSNANGSIAGNTPHNPFIDQTATWVLTIPGINVDTIVTSATFSFGTTTGTNVPGTVPDSGATVMLLGAALGGLGLLRRFVNR